MKKVTNTISRNRNNLLVSVRDKLNYQRRLKFIKVFLNKMFNKAGIALIVYNTPQAMKVIKLINQLKNESEILLHISEAYQIYKAVECTKKIPGDVAEVGVYKGGSAKIICAAKGRKKLHLFDTFEGFPYGSKYIRKGEVSAPLAIVKKYLKDKNIIFYKGIFPSTAKPVKKIKFSFVHLDVDLFKSTLDCLKFFYPRMNRGGIILSHDYYSPNIKRAFAEFFSDKAEPVIDLNVSQCLISKL